MQNKTLSKRVKHNLCTEINTTPFHLFMKFSAACAGTSGISDSSSAIFECVISPLSILIRIKSSVSF